MTQKSHRNPKMRHYLCVSGLKRHSHSHAEQREPLTGPGRGIVSFQMMLNYRTQIILSKSRNEGTNILVY